MINDSEIKPPEPPKCRIYYNGRFIDEDNPPFDYKHPKISFCIGLILFYLIVIGFMVIASRILF